VFFLVSFGGDSGVCIACPPLRHITVIGGVAEFSALDSLYDAPGSFSEPRVADVALLPLSGGSIGLPKQIPLTPDNCL